VTVCYGVIADQIGGAVRYSLAPPKPGTGVPALNRQVDCFPSGGYQLRQRAVRVDIDHDVDRPVGSLVYLEKAGGRLWAVTELRERLTDTGEWFFSPCIYHRYDAPAASDIRLESLALTQRPGSVGLGAVRSLCVRLADIPDAVLHRLHSFDAGLFKARRRSPTRAVRRRRAGDRRHGAPARQRAVRTGGRRAHPAARRRVASHPAAARLGAVRPLTPGFTPSPTPAARRLRGLQFRGRRSSAS
jgi:hypothetical protein